MKQLFCSLFMLEAIVAEGGAPVFAIAKVYTSAKLDELKAESAAIWAKMATATEAERDELITAAYKNKQAQAVEIDSLKAAERNAELEAKKNARLALLPSLLALYDKAKVKSATDEDKAAYQTAFDALQNELLGAYKGGTPSKPKEGGTSKATGTGPAIIAMFEANREAGMTDSEAEKAITSTVNPITGEPYSRGTTGAVLLATFGKMVDGKRSLANA